MMPTTVSPISKREAFEAHNPVPDDAQWSERKQGYYWKQHPGVSHPFNNDWMTWEDACEWQSKRDATDGSDHPATSDLGGLIAMPIAEIRRNSAGQVFTCKPDGTAFEPFSYVGHTLYIHRQKSQAGEQCTWRREPMEFEGNDWVSDCGASFSFTEDGPTENGFQHCPKCGRSLRDSTQEEHR
jgi:hypothetical protein